MDFLTLPPLFWICYYMLIILLIFYFVTLLRNKKYKVISTFSLISILILLVYQIFITIERTSGYNEFQYLLELFFNANIHAIFVLFLYVFIITSFIYTLLQSRVS